MAKDRRIHDYTRQYWGHATGGHHETGRTINDKEFNIRAGVERCHIFGSGLRKDDLVRIQGRSKAIYYLKIDSLEWQRDPSDMYYMNYHTAVCVQPGEDDPYAGHVHRSLFT